MSKTPPPYPTNHHHQDIVKHTEILDAYEDHKKSFDGEDDEGPIVQIILILRISDF